MEESLNSRAAQKDSVLRTGRELEQTAPPQDAAQVSSQMRNLQTLWDNVNRLCERKSKRLEAALKDVYFLLFNILYLFLIFTIYFIICLKAEKLHKQVHMLLEWLSDAETKLRFVGQLPEDDQEAMLQVQEHQRFMADLREKEKDKDSTISLAHTILAKAHPDGANVIKHWITIIQSRWDEASYSFYYNFLVPH